MPSVQRFLSGHNNAARTAALSASSVRASRAIERVRAARTGGGNVRLSGDYTGHEATAIDVEIVAAGGIPRASRPQFAGVGNGQLSVQGVEAAAPLQSLTLTLADLGIPTQTASLDVRTVQIRARAAGAAGNQIRLSVQPKLTRAPTDWALLSDWPAGGALQQGEQWDWGALPLSAQGELDERSPRIQVGHDPQVYRPYRVYKDGAWQFGLSPAPERALPKGAAVWLISGGYVVTVTDGQATQTYGDTGAGQGEIASFYDLLRALQGSALVEVAGVVAADRAVGGMAAIDVPLRTQAWLHSLSGKVELKDVTIPPLAPTQSLIVRCINADVVGRERWSVVGDVSGALAEAVTGQPYASAAARFVIPAKAANRESSGEHSFKYQPMPRAEGEGVPSVCLRPFRFGRNAKARTVTFRYQLRPPADCSCSDMPTPRLSLSCLGLDSSGGDMPLDPAHQSRLQTLYEWRKNFIASNTAQYYAIAKDMDFADLVTRHFAEALAEIYEVAAALAEWDAALVDMRADLQGLEGLQWTDFSGSNLNHYNNIDRLNNESIAVNTPSELLEVYGDNKKSWMRQTLSTRIADLARKYAARMDYCRALAGILPKSDTSSTDAGGCWIDHGGSHWWVDAEGYYLPAFSNKPYISSRRDADTGKPVSTMEFGFGLVVACPERLKEGDEITLRILTVSGERPYQEGDEAVIQTVAGAPAWLSGGVDGTDVQTWHVLGSVSGSLPDYIVPTNGAAAPVYNQAGVQLRLALGGIPFALGDAFSLSVEAGQWRWRRDGGPWSAAANIPATAAGDDTSAAPLADGLHVQFIAGAAPSFVPGDAYNFAVHQPWAVNHIHNAHERAWGWAGGAGSLTIDLGAPTPIEAIALARYHLPAGAQVRIAIDGGAPHTLETSGPVAVWMLPAPVQAARLTITVAQAEGGHIGWVWAGVPLSTDHHASQCQRTRRWAVGRAGGINPAGLYAGAGDGWRLAWSPSDWSASRLVQDDMDRLMALLDWAQQKDEPLILVPHHRHPQDAALVRPGADALEITDQHAWQADDVQHRLLSATLELEPVYA
ncbi:hypothetical protein EBQ26_10585 [Allofranklinella schreckenbergeri]|uniref:Uncharacterized protein n=1 Tax=Allofranklinella schreckenbergeri TaxID=1076744 RepID=A0A3M6Q004_9BURK|nr:hypothetical protein [Allofranklinella schreckenbergeri]RMW96044.1 hypothetical protein EBQ26_10585 [Allofranklinella schreckenbergeri]